ncbi:rRNA (cytosine-C(5))-methyltransferase NOP2C isoform X3 [Malus sylvestris]|uniref:rRNA (cytosine-C(5))-methyltransferase NOP2C isoform X3 n=1 Tax=Malus sylvestris TaxID=3752 RepID=UPI0021AC9E12|nr:rRNA (cytosine-C(5))-methyltransferase NOP2C isoform X3 [Malus sylvestris]
MKKKARNLLKTIASFFTKHHKAMDDLPERYSYNPTLRWNADLESYFSKAYGPNHFSRISQALSRPSCYSCIRVNTLKSTPDAAIEKLRAVLKEKGADISKCDVEGMDYVLFVRGSGPHAIDYGCAADGKLPKEVLVSRKCAEAVLRGAQVYVPGVLGCTAHVEKGDVVAVSVAVEQPGADGGWVVGITRGTVLQGSETDPQKGERILDMCAAPGGKTTAIALLMKDEGEIVAADRSHNKVQGIHKLAAEMGLSCITPYKLDALKSVCTTNESDDFSNHSCIKENHVGNVQGSDLIKSELEKSKLITFERLNAEMDFKKSVSNEKVNETTYTSKAAIRKEMRIKRNGPGRNQSVGGRVEKSKGFAPKSFDRVLLDAPCSALGLRPRLFAGEETIESMRKHATYQRRMLDQAVQLVRPGGVLVYSTCTINPGENEAVVRYALDTYKFLSLAPQHPRIGGPGLVGRFEFPDGYTEEWLRPGEEELVQRFDPSSSLDTIGFFIAKFSVGSNKADLQNSAS